MTSLLRVRDGSKSEVRRHDRQKWDSVGRDGPALGGPPGLGSPASKEVMCQTVEFVNKTTWTCSSSSAH
jgi:hypothetical protein